MQLSIEEVVSSRQLKEFIRLPRMLYRDDRYWVPPLRMSERELFDRAKHPFHEHADVAYFLARDSNDRITGRIAAVVNHRHNEYHDERTGFFGFLEGERDQQVFSGLLDKACEWTASLGMDTIRGPFNFSTNEECGLLVKGFDSSPLIMMPYNPDWYQELVEGAGFEPLEDLLAYWADTGRHDFSRLSRIAALVRRREDLVTRNFRMKEYRREVALVMDIYNECWRDNWGFVPMTSREFDHMGKELRMVLVSEFSPIIEAGGKPVAFAIALPDANQAIKAGRGRLVQTLLAMKVPPFRVSIDRIRVLLLGVRKAYRGRGLEAVLVDHMVRESSARGMGRGELSWVLSDNRSMRRILENVIGAEQYKTYRIYSRDLRTAPTD